MVEISTITEEVRKIPVAKESPKEIKQVNKPVEELPQVKQESVAPQPSTPPSVVAGGREDWLRAAGISESDWPYVDYIVNHEGGWAGTTRWNTGGSGAYGLCQALPASKMASAGSDYMTNPVTQLRWCNGYAQGKGGWYASYLFWIANNWW